MSTKKKYTHEASISVTITADEHDDEFEVREKLFLKLIHMVDDWLVGEVIPDIEFSKKPSYDKDGSSSTKGNLYLN